jgi:hypothetical protein
MAVQWIKNHIPRSKTVENLKGKGKADNNEEYGTPKTL